MELFWQAVLIGLAVAAPVGPMALLCLERTLARGQKSGLAFGLGIAAADASYALVAGLGVGALASALLGASFWIRLVGGLAMLGFGLSLALQKPAETASSAGGGASDRRAFLAAYLLTLANPPTIVFFAGVFASLGRNSSAGSPGLFTLGVFCGSALWWAIFTTAAGRGSRFFTGPRRVWIGRLAGAAVSVLALFSLAELWLSRN